MQQLSVAGIYVVQTFFGLYMIAVILRFLLQLARADFYNPVSQFVVKITSPVLNPLRRIIPGFGGIDMSSIVLLLTLQVAQLAILILLMGYPLPGVVDLLTWSVVGIFGLILNFYFFVILIQIILSWVAPHNHSPVVGLLYQISEPLMGPARRILPTMGGIDFSPMVVIMGIQLVKILVLQSLVQALGVPHQLLFGL
ncbi:MAG: YggT family protein [Moraxellaceae bacterium]|nr:MAG: YggT family protein [Moraxellaceae bacterium]